MGRTRKEGSPADVATRQLDPKSKAIDKAKARQARESLKKSYKEDSESDSEIDKLVEEPADKDFSGEEEVEPSPSESGSDWDGESSGSEYGKKKSVKGRGRAKKVVAASPKKGAGRGRGRGRPPAKGRASAGAAKNGSKKGPAPKRRRDDSDESEESEGESSGSEYGKKAAPLKKRGSTSRGSPAKKRATASPAAVSDGGRRGRGRASSSKSYKEISEDDFSEEEVVVKKPAPKSRASPKPASKKAKKNESEEEHFSDAVSGSEEDDEKRDEDKKDAKDKKKDKGNNSKPKPKDDAKTDNGNKATKNGGDKEADTSKEEKDSDNESKKSDSSGKSDASEKGKAKVDTATLKNRTETDYSAIDFKCDKKSPSGDTHNLRVASWNIGGIKAFIKKNGLDYIKNESPDILCLQEIKCNEKTKPEEVQKVDGYPNMYWSFADQPGMHGVAILSKTEPVSVKNGLPIADDDSDDDKSSKEKFNKEGRLITAEYEKFYLINAYVPNSGRGEKTDKDPKGYPPKINNGERQMFDEFLRGHVKTLEKSKPVVLTGDLNVSHTEIDLANPKTNERTAGYTKEEREGMSKLLEETTLIDSFRKLYPDQKGAYTFWSYMHNARQKNIGWRLDYFLISEKLGDSLCENLMRNDVYGSDHCPIVLFLHV